MDINPLPGPDPSRTDRPALAMNDIPAPLGTVADLMSKVGTLTMFWGMMEQELSSAIVKLRECVGDPPARVRGALPKRLEQWAGLAARSEDTREHGRTVQRVRDQVLGIAKARHLITHGIQAAGGGLAWEEAYVRCVVGGHQDPSRERVTYSLDDLDQLIQGIDACRRAFWDPRNFNHEVSLPVGCHETLRENSPRTCPSTPPKPSAHPE